ncbi:MAG: lipid-binding SYLF domain-containing protein, partial [Gammaproteobacteria bacterium]|nr:lipid-binding SYLF domain-containing protein [Gammaproteobacteria bacterium]
MFYKLNTASLGLQAGVERSEMVVLARTQSGLESLLTSSVKFGGKISAAAGPVGGSAITETEDIVYFVRKASGGFLGMSLDGVVIEPERELMTAYYGREATPMDVLVRGSV